VDATEEISRSGQAGPRHARESIRAVLTAEPSRRAMSVLGAPVGRLVAMAALVGLIVLGGATWVARSGPQRSSSARVPSAAQRATPSLRSINSAPAPSGAPVLDSTAAQRELARLAQLREEAFAQRSASLLSAVYPSGALLSQDVALLTRVVPPGCALIGVHTSYSDVRIAAATAGHAVILTNATLTPSQLRCAHRGPVAAPGRGPTRLRIELQSTAGAYRVTNQQPA
jgi:hypothetical protein